MGGAEVTRAPLANHNDHGDTKLMAQTQTPLPTHTETAEDGETYLVFEAIPEAPGHPIPAPPMSVRQEFAREDHPVEFARARRIDALTDTNQSVTAFYLTYAS